MDNILLQIAAELKVRPTQVKAAVDLLDGGATVPFISRYRKEATEGLDDTQLRELEARLAYLRELEERRAAVLKSIDEQGKLTPALQAAIEAAPTKQELEDLYLPFKPKRRTKAMIAREAGIEPLADALFADPTRVPLVEAAAYINAEAGFADANAVLDGVRDILSERWAEDAALVGKLREWLWEQGLFQSRLVDGKDVNHADVSKFRDYFAYAEPIRSVPSHRALAVFRGRTLELLEAKLVLDEEGGLGLPASAAGPAPMSLAEGRIAMHLGWSHRQRAADDLMRKCVAWTWKVKLSLSLERDLFARLREEAETRGDQGVRREPARPAARRTGRRARGAGPGPRHPHRLQGGGGRRHRQGAGHRNGLSARAATRLGGCAAHLDAPVRDAWREPDRDRQRHREPRDRQARRRADSAPGQTGAGRSAAETGRQRSGRIDLFGQRVRLQGAARSGREPCAARCRSRDACRTRSPSW